MILRFLFLSVFFCIFLKNSHAETNQFPNMFFETPAKGFNPTDYKEFNLIELELKSLVSKLGDTNTDNIFCASGFSFTNGGHLVTVIWSNKEELYWWDGASDPQERKELRSLWMSRSSDLKNTYEDGLMLSGTTAVSRSQAKAAIEYCEKFGQKYLVPPFTPEPKKTDDDFDDDEKLEYIDESEKGKN